MSSCCLRFYVWGSVSETSPLSFGFVFLTQCRSCPYTKLWFFFFFFLHHCILFTRVLIVYLIVFTGTLIVYLLLFTKMLFIVYLVHENAYRVSGLVHENFLSCLFISDFVHITTYHVSDLVHKSADNVSDFVLRTLGMDVILFPRSAGKESKQLGCSFLHTVRWVIVCQSFTSGQG